MALSKTATNQTKRPDSPTLNGTHYRAHPTRCSLRHDSLNTDDLPALLWAQLQTFFSIQAQHALVIDLASFASQQNAQKAIAPTRMLTSQLLQSFAHHSIIGATDLITQTALLQANQPARPPLRKAKAPHEVTCGLSPCSGLQKFFDSTS